jgi:Cu+-exporting ATPase
VAKVARPDGRLSQVLVGNRRLLAEHGLAIDESSETWLRTLDEEGETTLIITEGETIAGVIGLRDAVRPEAHDVIHDLKHIKIGQFALVTGDRESVALRVAKKVHIKHVHAEMLPADKARWIKEQQDAGCRVAMVGDGINDAPALAQADAGIALGAMGADLAAEAGDLILLGSQLGHLPELVELARATVLVIRQNIIVFAFGLNAVAVILASLGVLSPVAAAILHQVGSLLVLLNAMRLLVFGDWAEQTPIRQLRAIGTRINQIDQDLDFGPLRRWMLGHRKEILGGALFLLLALYATSGLNVIGPGELGLVQRFGGFRGVLEPGLHVRFPALIEAVTRVRPENIRSLPLGFRNIGRTRGEPLRWEASHGRSQESDDEGDGDAMLLTGDGQFLEITASLQYSLDSARPEAIRRFALGIVEPELALQALGESCVRSVVARRTLLGLLAKGRAEAEEASTAALRERVKTLDFGIKIHQIAFQDVHPPLAVLDAYRDVSRAENDRQRRGNEAAAIRSDKILKAQGKANATKAAAEADQSRLLASASSGADSFAYQLAARDAASSLTDFRLFWVAIADALAGKSKLIFDARADRPGRLILSRIPFDQSSLLSPVHSPKGAEPAGEKTR